MKKWETPYFDPRSLALFRIGLGIMMLLDLGVRSMDLSAHYSDLGIFPREAMDLVDRFFSRGETPTWVWSLHAFSGSVYWVSFLFFLQAILSVLLILGWRTRVVHLGCWVLLVSLQSRNPLIIYGADHVMRLLLFFSFFLPLNSCWSWDARAGRGGRHAHPWAVLAFTLQVALLYGFSFLLKSDAAWRSEWSAGLMALKVDFYVTEIGRWLSHFPELLSGMTAAVMVIEGLGAIFILLSLFFCKFRCVTLLLFAGLQLGLGLCFHLGFFPWISILALLPLLPWKERSLAEKGLESPFWGWGATFFIAVVAWVNVNSLADQRMADWRPLHRISEVFRLDQSWGLFAPYPLTDDGWFILEGRFDDGSLQDLLNPKGDLNGAKPEHYAATFPNHRWRKCFLRLRREWGDPFVPYLLEWIASQPDYFVGEVSAELQSLQLTFYQEITGFDGSEELPRAYALGSWSVPVMESN